MEIAHLSQIEKLPRNDGAFRDFPSRKDAYGKLWEELITERSSLVLGIYGMPGVGKTRMMEQLWKEAVEKKIFNNVVRADVGGETLDVIKLQNQIVGHLTCHLESKVDVKSRASQLQNWLRVGGKILLILDDVWGEIPLDDIIGTSFGESTSLKGSKILLTSRHKNVCERNKCERPVQITALEPDEARVLFQDTLGTSTIEKLQDDSLVEEVCTKCAGLPLLIRAVGKTLQFMSDHVWKDALQKLEKGNFKNIAGIDPRVYACVRLSIDRLQDDAKLCLFLCSLFPEDASIEITKLTQLSIGSQLIPDGESTIPAMVEVLTKSSLLLEYIAKHIYKLHDIIRGVARSIAFEDPKYAFLHVRCGSQLHDNVGYSTSKLLRLDVEGDDVRFLDDLVCTDLNTLWLQCNYHQQKFSGGFFRMFVNLGFLMLQNVDFHSEQFSLQPLDKLKMLILDECDIRKTDDSLFPKNLKTLCIWKCDLPSLLDLPILVYLQKLDIQENWGAEVIMVPIAIRSLSSLEELHIPKGFRFSDDAKDITPILDEISKLTRLTSLKIFFSDFEPSQDTSIFFKLSKYDIKVGGGKYDIKVGGRKARDCEASPKSTKMIDLTKVEVKRDEGLQSLMERAEDVILSFMDVDVSSICNSNREAFADLKYLTIRGCDTMECVARISQDEIQHSCQPQTSFSKLTNLNIFKCSAMKYLFSKSVAKRLEKLQRLWVRDCGAMEVIVMNESTSDGEIINFSKLKSLELTLLPSLRSFYREKKEMHWGSTDKSEPLFDGMVAFPSLEELSIGGFGGSDIWGKHIFDDNSFCKLKRFEVQRCSQLESVIPHAMLHRLLNLESLYILYCRLMRELIGGGKQEEITDDDDDDDDDDGGIIMFSELTVLRLVNLPNLTRLWCYRDGESDTYDCKVQTSLSKLTNMEISGCSKMKYLFSKSVAKCLEQLQRLWLNYCPAMEVIVMNEGTSDGEIINFSKLKSLELSGLQSLRSFYREKKDMHWGSTDKSEPLFDGMVAFPSLEKLSLWHLRVSDIWGKHIYDDNSFCKLKSLEVRSCSQLESVIPHAMLHRLLNLESLYILYCRLMRELIGGGKQEEITDDDGGIIVFPKLTVLELHHLSNLTRLWCYRDGKSNTNCYKVQFPSLVQFRLYSCRGINLEALELGRVDSAWPLEALHIETENQMRLPCKWKNNLYNLERLRLTNCWWHGLKSLRLPRLKDLSVFNPGRSALFTVLEFRSLSQLERLHISGCALLEEIVEDGRGDENSDTNDKIIVLSQLLHLTLEDLPNLRSFSRSVSYALNMPKLNNFRLRRCPRLENFTCLKTSTGLVYVSTDDGKCEKVTDLNVFIIQNHKRGSKFVEVLE